MDQTRIPTELQAPYTTLEYVLPPVPHRIPRNIYVFVIDTSMSEPEELTNLTKSIANSIEKLPQGAYVSIISFGKHAHLHDLSSEEGLQTIVFPGDKEVTEAAVQQALGDALSGKRGALPVSEAKAPPMEAQHAVPQVQGEPGGPYIVPVADAELQIHNVLESLCLDPWQGECAPDERAPRCTGTAMSLAVSLMSLVTGTQKKDNVRILLYVGGGCSYGPGAVVSGNYSQSIRSYWEVIRGKAPLYAPACAFFEALALKCCAHSFVVDLLAGSLDQYGLGEMKCLMEMTGGSVVLDDSFTHGCFQGSHKRIFAPDPLTGLQRLCFDVELTVYTSTGLKVSGAVGKLTSLNKKTSNVSDKAIGVGNTSAWRLCGADDTTTPCIFFEIQDFAPNLIQASAMSNQIPQSYIQFVTRYRNSIGQQCIRVTTISRSHVSFASKQGKAHLMLGFDPAAAAVVLAKLGVHNVHKNMRFEGHRWVDEILIKLVAAFHEYTKNKPATVQIASNFAEFAKYIYLLRRTEIFRYFSFSIDEASYARLVALHETTSNVMRMIQPELIVFPLDGQPYAAPLSRDVAQPSRIVLLDCFLMLVVWYPTDVATWRSQKIHLDPAYENVAEMMRGPVRRVTQILESRFPCPRFVECVEKLSQSRFFYSRIPLLQAPPGKATHDVGLRAPNDANSSAAAGGAPRDDYDDDLAFESFMNHLRFLVAQTN